jgi:hypothetical protein
MVIDRVSDATGDVQERQNSRDRNGGFPSIRVRPRNLTMSRRIICRRHLCRPFLLERDNFDLAAAGLLRDRQLIHLGAGQ